MGLVPPCSRSTEARAPGVEKKRKLRACFRSGHEYRQPRRRCQGERARTGFGRSPTGVSRRRPCGGSRRHRCRRHLLSDVEPAPGRTRDGHSLWITRWILWMKAGRSPRFPQSPVPRKTAISILIHKRGPRSVDMCMENVGPGRTHVAGRFWTISTPVRKEAKTPVRTQPPLTTTRVPRPTASTPGRDLWEAVQARWWNLACGSRDPNRSPPRRQPDREALRGRTPLGGWKSATDT